jgi:hypothetical protein
MGIKIVNVNSNKPSLNKLIDLRYGLMQLIVLVPFFGVFDVGLVSPLIIFGKEQRCLNDLIAVRRAVRV